MKQFQRTFNFSSPVGVAIGLLAVAAVAWAVLTLAGGLGLKFDPLNSTARRADRAQAAAVRATSDAGARRIEVAGAADTEGRVEQTRRRSGAAQQIVHRYTYSAQVAPDAHAPLDPERSARLHDLDRGLCELRPAACSAAAPGNAVGGEAGLSPGYPSDQSHDR